MKQFLPIIATLFCLLTNSTNIFSQTLSVTQGTGGLSPTQFLLDNFVQGGCVSISNVTYTGSNQAIGYFTYGSFEGIILSSGRVTDAVGSPSNTGFFLPDASTDLGTAGYQLLTNLAGSPTQDAAILQFDFVPTANTVTFNYSFASEEYPDYVGSNFNDVFAFGISGPGIAGIQNMAQIPGGGGTVSINNVNCCSNSNYYVGNISESGGSCNSNCGAPPPNQEFDGFTVTLTASATVIPCQTYHLTLAIADAGDGIYDSAVFLEAQSFSAGSGATAQVFGSALAGSSTTYEDCTTGYFLFERENNDLSSPVSINVTVTGTATPNVDYNPLIPSTITIPAGQASVQIPITAFADGIAEGTETISIQLPGNSCNCTGPPPPVVMNIIDNPPLSVSVNSQTICPGQSASLTAAATGGIPFPNYGYTWSNGLTTQTLSGSPPSTTTYCVTVTDICGNSASSCGTVTVQSTTVTPTISGPTVVCANDGNVALSANVGGGSWSGIGVNPVTGIFSPTAALQSGSNPFTVTYSINTACSSGSDTHTINIVNLSATTNANQPTCANNGNSGAASVTPTGGANYTYQWSTGGTNASINNQAAGTYFVTVTSVGGCTATASVTLNAPSTPSVGINVVAAPGCTPNGNNNNGQISASPVGGTPNYTYQWSAGNVTTSTVSNVPPGTYTLTVTDANQCTATSSVALPAPIPPTVTVSANNPPCATGGGASAVAVPTGGVGPFLFFWNNGSNEQTITGINPGTYTVTVSGVNNCSATASGVIIAPTPFTVSISPPTPPACNGGNNGSATAMPSGGTAPYTYNWSNGQTTATATNLSAGNYTVTVTDGSAGSCTATATVNIPQPTPINAAATATNVSCNNANNGTATVTASGGTSPYSYAWSGGGSSATLNNLAAGSYTVTVTDANGCTRTANATVTQPPALAASASATNLTCNNANNGTATATASGGTSPYSYAWNGGGSGATINNLSAGSYTVTITDANNCTRTANVTLTQPTPLSANANGTPPACVGVNNGFVSATASGGTSPYTFNWSNGVSGANNINIGAGSYIVTVTDANNCSTTANVTLTPPTPMSVSLTPTNPPCFGGANGSISSSVSGGTTPYTYQWSSGATTSFAPGLQAGSYAVTVTDNNACTATANTNLSTPPQLSVSLSPTNPLCNAATNGTMAASAAGGTPGYTYTWNNGQNGATINNIGAGNYVVTVSDTNGCTATGNATLTQPTPVSGSITPDNPNCNGTTDGSATVTASGGTPTYTYTWNNGQNTATATNLSAGSYVVTITDQNNCTATTSTNLTQPTPVTVSTTPTNPNCNNGSDGFATAIPSGGTPQYTIAWNNGSNGANNINLSAGTYTVTVTDSQSCSTTQSVSLQNPAPMSVSLTPTDPPCSGVANGNITSAVSGGTSPYTYLWNNGVTSSFAPGLQAANYTVTVTDDNACTATANVALTSPTPISVSISPTDPLCNGAANGSMTATASGGTPTYTYTWNNGQSGTANNNIAAGSYTVTVTDANGCIRTATATLAQPTPVVANIQPTPILCNGNTNGQALATASGGTPTYTYTWNNANNTNTNTNLAAGNYTVTVTDANNCTATATTNIVEPSVITIVANSTNVNCNGGSDGTASLLPNGGTAPYTVSWSNGQATLTANNLSAGTYTATVTDANNCSTTASATITEPTPITASVVADDANCSGAADGTMTVSAAGGTPTYSYAWSNGQTAATATTLTANTYTVTVTDSETCTATAQGTIAEPTPLAINISPINTICFGSADGSATATANGGTAPYTYTWNNGEGNATTNNLVAGNYTVTVTDAQNCSTTATTTIDQPAALTVAINGILNFCEGSSTDIIAESGFAQYAWSTGSGQATATVNTGGTYTVTVTSAAGCTATNTTTLVMNPNPQPNIAGDFDFCAGNNTTIQADANATYISYSWSTSAGTATIDVNTADTYTVTVTDANGCVGSDEQTITVYNNPTPTINGITSFCEGSTETLNANAGYSAYSWSTGAATQSINVTASDIYIVTVTDQNGCTGTTDANVVVFPPPAPAISGDTDFCVGQNTILDGGSGYQAYSWNTGEGSAIITVDQSGTYSVTVTDSQGCTASATIAVTAFPLPNPVISGDLDFCDGQSTTITVTTSFSSYNWLPSGNTQSIEVEDAGNYSVIVTDNNGCTGSTGVIVDVYNNPTPTISGDLTICPNQNTTLSITPTFVGYTWSNNSNNATLTTNIPDTYSVEVTDNNGCTGSTFAVVSPNTPPSPIIDGNTTICAGDNSIFDAGGGYDNYSWNDGSASQSINVDIAGTYTVTVTDSEGCTATDNITLVVNQPPAVGTFNATPANCGLNDGSLTFTNPDNATVTYSVGTTYNPAQNAPAVSPINSLSNDFYTFQFSLNGCNSYITAEVPSTSVVPIPEVSPDVAICFTGNNNNPTLTASNGTNYQWYGPNNANALIPNATNSTYTPTVTAAGSYIYYVSNTVGGCESAKVSVTLTINALPTPNISGTFSFCEGNSGNLDAGTGYDSYLWSDGSSTQSISPTASGTYSVTVTDNNGCSATDAQLATMNPVPEPNITGPLTFCTGFNTTLQVGGGVSYAWSNGSNTATIVVDEPAIYVVTVTDANACTGTDGVTVNENSSLSPDIDGVLSFCQGDNTTLDAGVGYNTYLWNNGATTQSLSVNAAGAYSVTVTDINGCSGTDVTNVSVNPNPVPALNGSDFCNGNNTTLIGEAGYTDYLWNEGSTTQSITVSAGGTYTLTVTNFNGCAGSNTITVNAIPNPQPVIIGNLSICEGDDTNLSTINNYTTYQWSLAPGDGQNILVTSGGDYTVTVTDNNGCSGTASTTVVENPNPTPIIEGALSFCTGFSTTLSLSENYNQYNWSLGSNSATQTVNTTTAVGVTVTDANGCVGSAQTNVTENANLTPAIVGDLTICTGETTTLNAGNGYDSYTWNTGATTQSIDVTAGGNYSVTVSDASGCEGNTNAIVVENANPTPNILGTLTFCEGNNSTLTLDNTYNGYQWSNGTFGANVTIDASDNISVTVTDANGCVGTDAVVVTENPNPTPLINGALSFCVGFNTTLSVDDSYVSYSWNLGSSTATQTVTTGGDVSVTVTDSNGCIGTDQVTTIQNTNLLPIIVGDLDICQNSTTTLDAGSGYANYLWGNGETTQTITANATGDYSVTVSDANGCSGNDSASVVVNPNPTPNIIGILTFCEDNNTTLSLDNAYDAYNWSNGTLGANVTIDASDNISVTVTDANGCVGTDAVVVTENPNPTPDISGALSFCEGFDTDLSVQNTYTTYSWNLGSNTATQTVTAGGDVSVTVTDANGCTGTDQVTVIESNVLFPTLLGDTVLCAGESSTLSVEGAYDTYSWSTGVNTPTITVTTADIYTVTVSNASGCSGTATIEVVVNTNPTPTIVGNTVICTGENTTLSVDNNFATYVWSAGSNTFEQNVSAGGVYSVTVTDANGCIGTDSQSVTQNAPPIAPVVSCANSTLNSVTFSWNAVAGVSQYEVSIDGGAPTIVNTTTYTVNNLPQGTTVTISVASVGTTGCGNSTAASANCTTIVEPPCPPLPLTITGLAADYCVTEGLVSFVVQPMGGNLTIDGQLNTGSFNTNALGEGEHTIAYTYTNPANDCVYDTTWVFQISPIPAATFDFDPQVCVGEAVTFTYTGTPIAGASYQWNFGLQGGRQGIGPHNITWDTPGVQVVSLTVTTPSGCSATQLNILTTSQPNVAIVADDDDILFGTSTTLTAQASVIPPSPLTYLWSVSTDSCSNTLCSAIEVTPGGTVNYAVTVTDATGCTATDDQIITVYRQNAYIIPNAFSPNGDNINDNFHITGVNLAEITIEIRDRWGQRVWATSNPTDLNEAWDGKYKHNEINAELGVYVYYATITFIDGTKERAKGNVTLVK